MSFSSRAARLGGASSRARRLPDSIARLIDEPAGAVRSAPGSSPLPPGERTHSSACPDGALIADPRDDKRPPLRVYEAPAVRERGRFISADPVETRVLDIIGASVALIVFGPLMLVIAALIWAFDPGPVFFTQSRVGRYGKSFKCYKFRTMVVDAEDRLQAVLESDPVARAEWEKDHKLRKDPRIIGIGRFLRKSSLDELPQLFNVLKGEMSLVGPRPIVSAEREKYGRYLAYYCALRPGITGLWQVSGRNDVSYRRRVAFDVVYAKHGRSKDYIRIILMTVPSVLLSRGSY